MTKLLRNSIPVITNELGLDLSFNSHQGNERLLVISYRFPLPFGGEGVRQEIN
ncbi:hypothetical protein HOV93_04640 [Planctomycetes bacterium FF15]|uniref:Uncharacterized protein n=1 Tax=Bremerella alba TaxID=980252 RepID=A0A7V9A5G1_9BACT|nr:hypothetical protein [Bremerella alba]